MASATVERRIYSDMLRRCYTPHRNGYENYGGRGITVCARWRRSFTAFLHDVGPRPSAKHSLERRNNNRGYTPANVYWATAKAQQRNKRNNLYVTFRGERKALAEWADCLGIDYEAAKQRLYLGWSAEDALTRSKRKLTRLARAQWERLSRMYASGKYSQHELGVLFNVHQSVISRKLRGVP